jgi:hypothetical protein
VCVFRVCANKVFSFSKYSSDKIYSHRYVHSLNDNCDTVMRLVYHAENAMKRGRRQIQRTGRNYNGQKEDERGENTSEVFNREILK